MKREKETAPLPEPKINHIKNEATGRMVCVGSRKYKELFPEAKKHVGRPSRKEKWDPIANYINLFKELGERELTKNTSMNWSMQCLIEKL